MSKCISRNGEFSDHELGEGTHEFTCSRCWAFDEDAAIATVAELRATVERCKALADEWERALSDTLRVEIDELRAALDPDGGAS